MCSVKGKHGKNTKRIAKQIKKKKRRKEEKRRK